MRKHRDPGDTPVSLRRLSPADHARAKREQARAHLNPEERCAWEGCPNPRSSTLTEMIEGWDLNDRRVCEEKPLPVCDQHVTRTVQAADRDIRARAEAARRQEAHDDRVKRAAIDPEVGTIYYLQVGDLIKIGWTSALGQRMSQYPPNAELLATEPGTRKAEAARHNQFREHLAKGREWFRPAPPIEQWVAQTVERHGPPPLERREFVEPYVSGPVVAGKRYASVYAGTRV